MDTRLLVYLEALVFVNSLIQRSSVTGPTAKLLELQRPPRDVRNVKHRTDALLALLVHLKILGRVIMVHKKTKMKPCAFPFQILAHVDKLPFMAHALLVQRDTIAQVEAIWVTLQPLTQSCVELERLQMQVQQLAYGMELPFALLERTFIHPLFIVLRIARPVLQLLLASVDLLHLLLVQLVNM